METQDLIKILKEIIYSYEYLQNPDNDQNKEIIMWRIRYLDAMKIVDPTERNYVMATPSKNILKTLSRYEKPLMES